MKKLTPFLLIILALATLAGCSQTPAASTTKKNDPNKQFCATVDKMAKARKGMSQVGPGTSVADAAHSLQRMADAYSGVEKFVSRNPDYQIDDLKAAYQTFQQSVPSLGLTGEVGPAADQLRAALAELGKAIDATNNSLCPAAQ